MPAVGGVMDVGGLKVGVAPIVFGTDANKTLAQADYENSILDVTSSVSLTATRDLILPLSSTNLILVVNGTSGGQSIRVIGPTGTGITIATAKSAWIFTDGINWRRAGADF